MGEENNGSAVYSKAVGSCPEVSVCLGGVENVGCLLDTGAQVSTITESFFNEHLAQEDIVDVSEFISISGAQGLAVPYRGYVELSLEVMGRTFPGMGFLVVRDPVHSPMAERKKLVPAVIGSNVLRDVNKALKVTSEQRLQQSGSSDATAWVHVLALYEEVIARNPNLTTEKRYQVRSGSRKPVLLPARCSVTVDCTTHRPKQPYVAVVDGRDVSTLPNGLVLLPTLVRVPSSGRVPVQMVNFGNSDVYLAPRTPVGVLEMSPTGSPYSSGECSAACEEMYESSASTDDVSDLMNRMEIDEEVKGSPEHLEQVRETINKHFARFSKDDMDIGYCDKVEHKIILNDDRPVRLPHRRIPPHQWN